MKKIILLLFLSSSVAQAQLFGGWILPSNEQSCFTGTGDGSSLANTAWSCKYIKVNFPTRPSGLYYIDIDGTGSLPAFRGYCDMTTDGGGWLLIGKSKFTPNGPSKVEMTGDQSIYGLSTDPWSGGALPLTSTELNEFTYPASPDYFTIGYNGDALRSTSDDLSTTAPTELYAIMSRDLIEAYRSSPCINYDRTKAIMKYNRPPNPKYTTDASIYIQTNKRFNPIQHKCATSSSTCNGTNLTGCATDFITNSYTTYNNISHTATGLNSFGSNWQQVCVWGSANGTTIQTELIPSGWAAGTSTFYDLSSTDQYTSGGIIDDGGNFGGTAYYYCEDMTFCTFKLLWLK